MKTHRTLICLFLVGIAALAPSAFSAEKVIESQWAAVPVRIDGANQEWQDASVFVDKGSKAEYALRNDGKYLYILFVFKSIPAMSTYEVSGMKVYYSLAGKKGKGAGFHFVKKTMTADQLIAGMEKNGEVLTDENKTEIRKQKAYMTYEGLPVDPAKAPAPPAGAPADAPTFRDKLSQKLSVVEFRIPLARLVEAGAEAGPGSPIKLGFEWGGMTTEMRSAYMARQAEAGSQARGTGGGDFEAQLGREADESGGGGGGAMGGRPDPRTKKHSFWVDIKLAAKVS